MLIDEHAPAPSKISAMPLLKAVALRNDALPDIVVEHLEQ
jgi:hypothetical protein